MMRLRKRPPAESLTVTGLKDNLLEFDKLPAARLKAEKKAESW